MIKTKMRMKNAVNAEWQIRMTNMKMKIRNDKWE